MLKCIIEMKCLETVCDFYVKISIIAPYVVSFYRY